VNVALWVAQALLAVVFLGAGASKLTRPYEAIASRMGYAREFSAGQMRAIGLVEVLGAVGVVGPPLVGVAPGLAVAAAYGLALDMAGAMATHLRRREYGMMAGNAVLLLLATFVAYGRMALVPL
jgi:hypothetical protein